MRRARCVSVARTRLAITEPVLPQDALLLNHEDEFGSFDNNNTRHLLPFAKTYSKWAPAEMLRCISELGQLKAAAAVESCGSCGKQSRADVSEQSSSD